MNKYTNTVSKEKPKQGKVFIYTLCDPITKEVRYVGKTIQSLYVRYCDHISFKNKRKNSNYRNKNWIKSLLNKNLYPEIELLDEVNFNIWENEEIFYISYLKFIGLNLVNHQIGGGQGNTGKKWNWTNEQKEKQLKRLLERNYKLVCYNTKGEKILNFKNAIEISKYFNILPKAASNHVIKKTLINQEFIVLRENEIFSKNLLKRSYRKIILKNNNTGKEIIFKTIIDTCNYLKCTINILRKYLDKEILFNNKYKIIRY
jgi:hypothetical protein